MWCPGNDFRSPDAYGAYEGYGRFRFEPMPLQSACPTPMPFQAPAPAPGWAAPGGSDACPLRQLLPLLMGSGSQGGGGFRDNIIFLLIAAYLRF